MPEESQNPQASKPSVLDKPVPNPLAKNPNVYTHKVFASIGLILIGTIIVLSAVAYLYRGEIGNFLKGLPVNDQYKDKQTGLEKPATKSATKVGTDETAGWKTHEDRSMGIRVKYPNEWLLKTNTETYDNFSIISQTKGEPAVSFYDSSKYAYDSIIAIEIGKSTVSGEYNAFLDTRLKNITIDGTTALVLERLANPDLSEPVFASGIEIYFEKNGSYYKVQFTAGDDDPLKAAEKTFYLIVSTIKFL